jgi:hypothetical protein
MCFRFVRRFITAATSNGKYKGILCVCFAESCISFGEFDFGSTRESQSKCKFLQRQLADIEDIFVFVQMHRADVGDECLNNASSFNINAFEEQFDVLAGRDT